MNTRVRLHRIEADPVTLHFSPGYGVRARELGELVREAHEYLAGWLGVQAHTTLSVLRQENWRYLRRAPYGYLHSSPEQSTIFVPARYPPRLVARTRELYEAAPPELREGLCAEADLQAQIDVFYRLVVVHELGHLFIHHLQLALGTHWLTELIANYLATSFFVEVRPDLAPCWFGWAAIQASLDVPHRTLEEYEAHFEQLDFANANYYQGRFNQEALRLWEQQGRALIPALAAQFGLRHEAVLARFLQAAPQLKMQS
jgi:hypothetical protein